MDAERGAVGEAEAEPDRAGQGGQATEPDWGSTSRGRGVGCQPSLTVLIEAKLQRHCHDAMLALPDCLNALVYT